MRPVLVIAFKFPPYSGVGGFRWAKMAKYLARCGREVRVVTVDWEASGPVTLLADCDSPRIHVHHIGSGFPHNQLLYGDAALKERAVARLRELGGFDEAANWGQTLIPFCQRLIRERGIGVAVATGHPFMANLWAAELKARTPGLKLVQDFRDLVSSIRINTGASEEYCLDLQRRCVEAADVVTVISPGMAWLMREQIPPGNSGKFRVMRNGFDPERLAPLRRGGRPRPASEPLSMCYLGSLGGGRHTVMLTLLRAVDSLVHDGHKVRVRLCGDNHAVVGKEFPHLMEQGVLELSTSMPPDGALRLARECDFGLNVLAPGMTHYLPTKIYDYIGLGVPCLSIGPKGDTSELLEAHDCGVGLPEDEKVIAGRLGEFCRGMSGFGFKGVDALGVDTIAREFNELFSNLEGEGS